MLALIALPLILTAGPRGPSEFDTVIYLPRLDRATQFTEFLRAGGERTVLLRSENWREALHPLLRFDITRPETATEMGLDDTQALTLVLKGDIEVSCATVKDLPKFQMLCADRMKPYGDPWKAAAEGVQLVGVKDVLGRIPTGYALKGNEACAVRQQGKSVEGLLKEVAKWLKAPPQGPAWKLIGQLKGTAYFLMPHAVAALNADGLTTVADIRGELPFAGFGNAGPSPFESFPNAGALIVLKVRAPPEQLGPVLEQLSLRLMALCPGCVPQTFVTAAHAMAPTLTGNVLVVVTKVKVQASLRTEAGRFFALRTAVLAESKDPQASRVVLATIQGMKGAQPLTSGEGLSVLLREGEVSIGVRGSNVYIANDAAALEAATRGLPQEPAKQLHGAETTVDPKLLAQGLSQVPLLDAVQSGELAGILAAGAELGPLLLGTEKITGWADWMQGSQYKAQLTWKLKPPSPRDGGVGTDGGVADGGT
jgi:hypothetical protein